jgi:predicted transcriptional regulator
MTDVEEQILQVIRNAGGCLSSYEIYEAMGMERLIEVYPHLLSLETAGLVYTEMGEATPERGGRRKHLYKLPPEVP